MALQLRRKTHESVVYIDRDSAPRIMPSGEDFILEDLPIGTRVLYPNPPIKGLPNREAAIRYALNHPLGCDPLFAQLEPGMRVTVAVDDISLPLPPMARPTFARRCSKSCSTCSPVTASTTCTSSSPIPCTGR
jgi:hypothetical protein